MNTTRRRFLKSMAGGLVGGAAWPRPAALADPPVANRSADDLQIESVRYLGNQFLDNQVNVTGADGATGTVLPSGDAMWVFGDTVEGPFKSIAELHLGGLRSNTAAIVPAQDASLGIRKFRFLADGDRPRQIVPFAADEDPDKHRVWAIHGVCVGRQLYLFYHRITLLEGVNVFVNFQLDGMGIARADVDELKFTRLPAPDGTLEFWKGDEPSFGVFIERDNDFVYLWGCLKTQMFLARTRPDSIGDLAAYAYLVTAPTAAQPGLVPRWSNTFEPTAPLFDSVPNEMSAAYNPHLRNYAAFHSMHREHKILMRIAPQRTGPWSAGEVVYEPQRIGKNDLIYAAKEHPELAREDGRVLYVTFVNSATYVPQLIEVRLR